MIQQARSITAARTTMRNAEGASPLQRLIEGPARRWQRVVDDASRITPRRKRNADEDGMLDALAEGGNEALLDRAMLAVTEEERKAVRLWYGLDGDALTKRQIADQIGKQLSAAKKYVQRALKKIKREWERQQDKEQRSYAYAALPTNWNKECHRTALNLWGDLQITKESYLRQLELREKFRKMALEIPPALGCVSPISMKATASPASLNLLIPTSLCGALLGISRSPRRKTTRPLKSARPAKGCSITNPRPRYRHRVHDRIPLGEGCKTDCWFPHVARVFEPRVPVRCHSRGAPPAHLPRRSREGSR